MTTANQSAGGATLATKDTTNDDVSPKRTKVLFIGGMGRSGSTLIEKLINELPATRSVGETLHLWERGVVAQERCGCGQTFGECPFWSAVGEQAFGGWDNIAVDDVIDMRYKLDRSRRFGSILKAVRSGVLDSEQEKYVSYYHRLLDAAASIPHGPSSNQPPVLLESSKHVSTAGLLAAGPHLDVRVLHVVRDPRGVAHSWTKKVERPETAGKLMPRYRPSRTALRWVTDNSAFDILGRTVPTLRLRYESFLENPVQSLTDIADFVGVELDAGDLDFIDGPNVQLSKTMHSASGNPMRFTSGDSLTLRQDEAWRSKLSAPNKALVTTMTLPSLLRYGYPIK